MDKVAVFGATDRQALFNETGATLGLANAIVEKDFWVCWILKRLFEWQTEAKSTLVFKGGTSLSKAFGVIRRFSEDIDLSFDRKDLGYTGERDPQYEALSGKAAGKLIDALAEDVERHIAKTLLPALRRAAVAHLGEGDAHGWKIEIDPRDPHSVNFSYPKALAPSDYTDIPYIAPNVKLEFGARGDPWPTEERRIQPFAADEFPAFFQEPSCTVTTLSARRTFWEKVTALHAEHHRPISSPTPLNFSRHYYDVAMLAETDEGQAALADLALLKKVAEHKAVFYRSAWAAYGTAKPGTLKLVPPETRLKDLSADYRAMAPMMFDASPPAFDENSCSDSPTRASPQFSIGKLYSGSALRISGATGAGKFCGG